MGNKKNCKDAKLKCGSCHTKDISNVENVMKNHYFCPKFWPIIHLGAKEINKQNGR